MLSRQLRRFLFRKIHQFRNLGASSFRPCGAGAVLVVAGQFFESQRPTVSLICYETLKHRQGRRLAVCRHVLNGAGKRRYAVEVGLLCQVPSNFAVGIWSPLLTAKQLHN